MVKRGSVITIGVFLAGSFVAAPKMSAQQPPVAAFKSGVDVVRISAIVRDRRGRFVRDLAAKDFEVIDGDRPQRISDFRHDLSGISVAMLFDVSGSMEGQMANAREAAQHVLAWLDDTRDEVAFFTFDSRLDEVLDFTTGVKTLPDAMTSVEPFGATSLYDAIAETAREVGERQGRRHAVVVFTDGSDTSSQLPPSEVSGIASSIDVPVYIFGIVSAIDNPAEEIAAPSAEALLEGELANLAAWTGGHMFAASTIVQRSVAARQIVDELRHQYLIAFESSGQPGWHPLVVRARSKDLVVRARSGYYAGQSRPNSH
jgi:Ca-activated chloride channel family protein